MTPVISIAKDFEGILEIQCSEGQEKVGWSVSDSLKKQLITEINSVKEGGETAESGELLESILEMLSSGLPADYYDE